MTQVGDHLLALVWPDDNVGVDLAPATVLAVSPPVDGEPEYVTVSVTTHKGVAAVPGVPVYVS
ncbi:MAG TPA: hypothetical protein VHA75_01040, partial [Rugosimonospora sp.]|nr:hypothetical protein [Rugosimonospora sp.]